MFWMKVEVICADLGTVLRQKVLAGSAQGEGQAQAQAAA